MTKPRSLTPKPIISSVTGQPKTPAVGLKRTDKTGKPMSVCALEAAKLDAATLPRIKQIQKSLEHAKAAARAETDPFKKHQLATAAMHFHAALDRLRVGPYGVSSDDRQP